MRQSNKSEAFKLARALSADASLDDVTLERAWVESRCAELPEPLDAIWLQCVLALPNDAAIRCLQIAAYHTPITGRLDDATMARVRKAASVGVEELLLIAQAGHYVGMAQRDLCGFDLDAHIRRIDRCNEWLGDWTEQHRVNVPLHVV